MRTVVHLSDIHFGRVDRALVEPLVRFVQACEPDLVAISGDLTQRARDEEYRQARTFLDSLPTPRIVVPGNHDVPLYNVYRRFLKPLAGYRRHISQDIEPAYADAEIAVLGVNSARSLTFKGGRINILQVSRIREWLCPFPDRVMKIIVTHHPFEIPEGGSQRLLVGRARMVMEKLAGCGADVFLSGHLHLGIIGLTATRYRTAGVSALIVQAGTATSTRGRGEANSFNVLRIDRPRIEVDRIVWHAGSRAFQVASTMRFLRTETGWSQLEEPA